jgi:heat shock protein HslJ
LWSLRLVALLGITGLAAVACSSSDPAGSASDPSPQPAIQCGRWVREGEIPTLEWRRPRQSPEQLLAEVVQLLKAGPVPLTSVTMRTGTQIVVELDSETHACEIATAIALAFPDDPVFVTAWPPASLAEEGNPFFGTWRLAAGAPLPARGSTLELKPDGTFIMMDLCNYKGGRWQVDNGDGRTITFVDVVVTAKACPEHPDMLDLPRSAELDSNGDLRVEQRSNPPLGYSR